MDATREIENLIYQYAERIDAGDLEGVAALFRHGSITAPAEQSRRSGYDQVLDMYRNFCRIYPETGTPRTRHVTTNVFIEVNQETAIARGTFTVFQATESLPLQPIIVGRYNDQFGLIDEQWHFTERAMYVDMLGDCSAHLLSDSAAVS